MIVLDIVVGFWEFQTGKTIDRLHSLASPIVGALENESFSDIVIVGLLSDSIARRIIN